MNIDELKKTYQKTVLKTNGGVDDYVVALCQIGNAIGELDDQQQQINDLQHRLKVIEKALELAYKRLQDDYCINCDNQTNCSRVEMCERALSVYLPSDFKEQVEKEMRGEQS